MGKTHPELKYHMEIRTLLLETFLVLNLVFADSDARYTRPHGDIDNSFILICFSMQRLFLTRT